MNNRSSKPEVRNPVLALPAAQRLAKLPPDVRWVLHELLVELSRDASDRAIKSWKQHKAPMAAYWKAVAVYSRHISMIIK